MRNYLFLDIDGVLNLERSRKVKSHIYGKEEFFMNDIYDISSMLYLKMIINQTKARIILTSNRRADITCYKKFICNLRIYDLLIFLLSNDAFQ